MGKFFYITFIVGAATTVGCAHQQSPSAGDFAELEGLEALAEPAAVRSSPDELFVQSFFEAKPVSLAVPSLKFPASIFVSAQLSSCMSSEKLESLAQQYNIAYSRVPDVLNQPRVGLDRKLFVNSNVIFAIVSGNQTRALFVDGVVAPGKQKLEPVIVVGCDSLGSKESIAIVREYTRLYLAGSQSAAHVSKASNIAAEKVRARYISPSLAAAR